MYKEGQQAYNHLSLPVLDNFFPEHSEGKRTTTKQNKTKQNKKTPQTTVMSKALRVKNIFICT